MSNKYIVFVVVFYSHHQIACFKVTEELHPPYRAAVNQQYSVASFATLRNQSFLSRLGSPVRFATL
jgi:hypothetical protein